MDGTARHGGLGPLPEHGALPIRSGILYKERLQRRKEGITLLSIREPAPSDALVQSLKIKRPSGARLIVKSNCSKIHCVFIEL